MHRQSEKGEISNFSLAVLVLVLTAVAAGILVRWYLGSPTTAPVTTSHPMPTVIPTPAVFKGDPAQATDDLLKTLNQKLEALDLLKLLNQEVQTQAVTVQGKVFLSYREQFRLPDLYTPAQLTAKLNEAVKSMGAQAVPPSQTTAANGDMVYSCAFSFDPQWTPVTIDWVKTASPRICLIIDDTGYQKGEALEDLYGFKVPVTASIIPEVQFSKTLAEELPGHGVEVMCHLPMEGHEVVKDGTYKEFLKKGMDTSEAKSLLKTALDGLPNCRGLNNHMGSVATTDLPLMKAVCEVLKERNLFIIDSKTSAKAVVTQAANETHLPVAHREFFLDNVEKSTAIAKQMKRTAAFAKKHGLAVAIGHFKVITLKTLEEAVQSLKSQGYQFVYASEVVQEQP